MFGKPGTGHASRRGPRRWRRVFMWRRFSQQSSRRWENQGPLRRICYEFSVVASQLKRAEATKGDSKQVDDIVALWRKRSELAKRIVEAAASTIEDVVLKMAMTEFLLLEGDLRVGLIPAMPGGVRSRARSRRRRGAMFRGSGAGTLGIVRAGRAPDGSARGAMGLRRAEQGSRRSKRRSRRFFARKGVERAERVHLERRTL